MEKEAVPFLNMWERRKLSELYCSEYDYGFKCKKMVLFESSFIFYVCGILPSLTI